MRAVAKEFQGSALEPRDRALARLIAATVLRRLGELEAVLNSYLEKPLPKQKGALWPILLSGAAQLLFLETPPHAAVGPRRRSGATRPACGPLRQARQRAAAARGARGRRGAAER